jgi:hypothetical protein
VSSGTGEQVKEGDGRELPMDLLACGHLFT